MRLIVAKYSNPGNKTGARARERFEKSRQKLRDGAADYGVVQMGRSPSFADELVIRAHEAVLEKWPDQCIARLPEKVKYDPLHTPVDPDDIIEQFLDDRSRIIEGQSGHEITAETKIATPCNSEIYAVTVADWSTLNCFDVRVHAVRGDVHASAPSDAPSEVEEYARDAFG